MSVSAQYVEKEELDSSASLEQFWEFPINVIAIHKNTSQISISTILE